VWRRPYERRFRGLDALHFPLSVMLPPVDRPPAVTSVLDVQHEFFPEFFPRAEVAYRKVVYLRTVRRSRLVITISEHAAGTIRERLAVPWTKLRPIHLGIDHERFRPGPEEREDFLLYPARPWPHKNHARLFEALELLPGSRLVLTGYDGPVPDGVESLGRVSLDELASLYRRAATLVFPSLYEGFGLPVLEAMARGVPVATSDRASLPEVAGDAALLFDPERPAEIAAAIESLLADPARAERLRAAGRERAARFSWRAAAEATLATYRRALDVQSPR
jgi:glycosyltransferase involved in cell wall biosynthesis